MIAYNTAVVLAGTSLLGASSGLIGVFALLRRRALLGDTLAHAALPGLCLGFLLWQERNLPVMLTGAFLSGLAGIAVVAGLRRFTRIKDDAALGIVLSLFFGAGLALLKRIQTHAVGGSRAGLDHYIFGSAAGMIAGDVAIIATVALCVLTAVLLLYKEFRLVTFDDEFARAQGWPAALLDLLIMLLIALTVTVALPAAGVVLTAALVILPAAAARFCTQRLSAMLAISALFGASSGVVGTLASASGGIPTGPMIVLAGAGVFLAAMLCAPRRGIVSQMLAQRRARRRIERQKLLLAFDATTAPVTIEALRSATSFSPRRLGGVLRLSERDGFLRRTAAGAWTLTDLGRSRAAAVARAQRLWRRFLTSFPESVSLFNDLDLERIDEVLPAEVMARLEQS
ncbi:MAG TPA: iron chelate uptake ABC transporter family permease subunit [Pirellulales bacterium]